MVQRRTLETLTQADVDAYLALQRSSRTADAYRRDLSLLQEFVGSRAAEAATGLDGYRAWLLAAGDSPNGG